MCCATVKHRQQAPKIPYLLLMASITKPSLSTWRSWWPILCVPTVYVYIYIHMDRERDLALIRYCQTCLLRITQVGWTETCISRRVVACRSNIVLFLHDVLFYLKDVSRASGRSCPPQSVHDIAKVYMAGLNLAAYNQGPGVSREVFLQLAFMIFSWHCQDSSRHEDWIPWAECRLQGLRAHGGTGES